MFGRFKVLPELIKTGRLAWRLFRDPRVPMAAKLILGATALYLASPIDLSPDVIPGLGQVDDVVALIAGLNLFIKACPRPLVNEHEARLGGRRSPDDEQPRRANGAGSVIEGRYTEVK